MKITISSLALVSAASLLFCLPPAEAITPSDLLGHWTFDTDTNSSVGGWTGTRQGFAKIGASHSILGPGCYHRDMYSGYLETNLKGPVGSAARSVSIWFKTLSYTGDRDCLCGWGGTDPNKRYDFRMDSGNLRIETKGSSKTFLLSPGVNDHQWHHALLAFPRGDCSNHTLYIDGKLAARASSTVPGPVNTSSWRKLRIGTGVQRHGGDNQTIRDFDGSIDDFGLFNQALSATDAVLINGLGRLGLDLSHLQPARNLWAGPDGGTAKIGGLTWERTSGLSGRLGDYGGTIAKENAYIVLDDSGDGLAIYGEDLAPLSDLVLTPAGDLHIDLGSGYDTTLDLTLTNRNTTLPAEWEMRFDGNGYPPRWFHTDSLEGRIDPGQSVAIPCQINQPDSFFDGLDPGTYSFRFAIVPPRTLEETIPAETWRTVEVTVAEPTFTTDPPWGLTMTTRVATKPEPARIHIVPTEGNAPPENIVVETDQPWLTATLDEDEAGTVILTADITMLESGSAAAHVTIKNDETARSVNVWVDFESPQLRRLVADPLRNVVYGLDKWEVKGYVAVIEPKTAKVRKMIPVGLGPNDLAFSPDGSDIYVASNGDWEICRIDPETREVTRTIRVPDTALPPVSSYNLYPSAHLAADSQGRIFYTKGGNILAIDFQSGQVLDTFEFSDLPADLVEDTKAFVNLLFDSRENRVYFTRNARWFGALEFRDGQFHYLGGYPGIVSPSTINYYDPLMGDLNGDHLFFTDQILDRPGMTSRLFPDRIACISAYGTLAFTRGTGYHPQLRDTLTGYSLHEFDYIPDWNRTTFTPDQSGILTFHHSNGTLHYHPLPEGIELPAIGIHPEPPDGGVLMPDRDTLSWTELPMVKGYRVFLGASRQAVAAAQPGSPADKGFVAGHTFRLDPMPASGPIYWRLDALRGETVIPGEVFSFSLPPFKVGPEKIAMTLPVGSEIQSSILRVSDPDDNPVSWSADSPTPWIDIPNPTGTAGETLEIRIDPDGLEPGTHTGAVRVVNSGFTIEVPVRVEIFQLSLFKLLADPNSTMVYGLHPGEADRSPSYIAEIDPASGKFTRAWQLDGYARDFCIHPLDNRIHALLGTNKSIQSIDLATGEIHPPVALQITFNPVLVSPARKHLVCVETYSSVYPSEARLVDTETGEKVAALPSQTYSGTTAAATTVDGLVYFRQLQGRVEKFDISTNEPKFLDTARSSSIFATARTFLLSLDSSRLASNTTILDSSLSPISQMPEHVLALTSDGEVAATDEALFWTDSGLEIAALPFDGPLRLAITSDDRSLVAWETEKKKLVVVPLASLVSLPGPTPRPGQRLESAPDVLSWPPVDGATRYHVYFGTDKTLVSRATAGSDLEIGTPTEPELEFRQPTAPGNRYYWRVDVVTSIGTVKGEAVYFDEIIQSHPEIITPPEGIDSSFGSSLAAWSDTLAIGGAKRGSGSGRVALFRFDAESGSHETLQVLSSPGNSFYNNFENNLVMGPGALVTSDSRFEAETDSFSPQDTGQLYTFQSNQSGIYMLDSIVSKAPVPSQQAFGSTLGFGANLLLARVGQSDIMRTRVHSWFQHPGWNPGSELVPSPQNDHYYFGQAIAMDGARAIIGAPGDYTVAGSAFVFEFDARRNKWKQLAQLKPRDGSAGDPMGKSVAIDGSLAVLGHTEFGHPSPHRVCIFTRRPGGSWFQSAELRDPVEEWDTNFGAAIAISGDYLFIAAPYGRWTGQVGKGVVYCYKKNGNRWDMLPPILPPPNSAGFGMALLVHDGLLFVPCERFHNDKLWDVYKYRLWPDLNRKPRFLTPPPIHFVSGKPMDIEVLATDPDGNEDLTFPTPVLPAGLALEDLGSGRARITGTPTDPPGTQRPLRIDVADPTGATATQIALTSVLSPDDAPVIGGLPDSLDLETGGALTLEPSVTGAKPFTWQWQRDGIDIPGATGPVLFVDNLAAEDAGAYTVAVANAVDSVVSSPVAVSVRRADRVAGNWTTYGGEPGRSGHQTAELGRHTFQLTWETQTPEGRFLHQPVIAEGRVFVAPGVTESPAAIRAYDLQNGSLTWEQTPESGQATLGPPSWHEGRIYLSIASASRRLLCLDAATGTPFWNLPGKAGGDSDMAIDAFGMVAPITSDYGPRLIGYDHDGNAQFRTVIPEAKNQSGIVPAIHLNRLYLLSDGIFGEYRRHDGPNLWSREIEFIYAFGPPKAPVVRGSRAYMIAKQNLTCLDTDSTAVQWSLEGGFTGDPALFGELVYAIKDSTVRAFSVSDGSEMKIYDASSDERKPKLTGQPLLLNDCLITASRWETFVFDLATAKLLQTIPHGGWLGYAADKLVITDDNGVIHAYYPNVPPDFDDSMPDRIDSGDAAGDMTLPLAPFAGDPDPGDTLSWAIVSVSNTDIFRTLEVDPVTGDLTVIYNPWQSGTSDVVISITDSAGNVTETTITFTVPEHPEPQIDVADSLVLNRQTGLYEHTITVTNSGAREVAGFDLTVTGLPEGVCVWNASDCTGGATTIQHRQTLAAGASVTLVLEYYASVRGTVLNPEVTVELVVEPESDPAAPDGGFAIDRCLRQADGAMLIEFTAEPGALYEVHYSDDGENWKLSPVRVRAAGNRVQWIDRGPPRTDTAPADAPSRFYRVKRLQSASPQTGH